MPRNNSRRSSPNKNSPNKNAIKKNPTDSPEQKTIGGRRPDGEGNANFPPPQSAAIAASLLPLAEEPLEVSSPPIAKPEDPSSTKDYSP